MLTIDDINSIKEKYGDIGFWVEIPISLLPTTAGESITINHITFTYLNTTDSNRVYDVVIPYNSFKGIFIPIENGEMSSTRITISKKSEGNYEIKFRPYFDLVTLWFANYSYVSFDMETGSPLLFRPLSNLIVPVINGEFDDHFYIEFDRPVNVTINNMVVDLNNDEKGYYLKLPSANDCVLGTYDARIYNQLYKVIFKEFKTLPILSIPTIYKGNTQTIQLLDDTEEITEFQAYYKGELLTDNKITLPYDADDYIDITVDLLDNRYPNSTLKLKAPTQMYIANSQSDVETAIANGITTLQVGDTETEVLLNGIELRNITLVDSNIQLTNSTLNNCTILNSQYTDNGANTITNTIIRNTDYTNTSKSTYENTSFYNSRIQDSELQITGTIYECELTNSLIISDGTININNNTFTGIGSKTYFPSHLYLTGDYIVSGNTFNLTGTFTELSFNMCLIKATNDFNVGDFINKNTFNLNIEYETENPSTLYYNIVDDDKIRARRV